jgi:hypothetical protein
MPSPNSERRGRARKGPDRAQQWFGIAVVRDLIRSSYIKRPVRSRERETRVYSPGVPSSIVL